MSKPEFVYVTYIETTPEKLWEALTDGDFTERYWFGAGSGRTGRSARRSRWCAATAPSPTPARSSNATRRGGSPTPSSTCPTSTRTSRPALATFVLEPYGKLVKLTLTHEGFRRRQQVLRRHLQGMAGDPVQPQEHSGNRASRCEIPFEALKFEG